MSGGVFSFVRRGEHETLFVAVNRSDIPQTPLLPPELDENGAAVLYGDPNRLVLPALGALIVSYPAKGRNSAGTVKAGMV
jgi:hypothetical protein